MPEVYRWTAEYFSEPQPIKFSAGIEEDAKPFVKDKIIDTSIAIERSGNKIMVKEIIIKTQAEFDALPSSFQERTEIIIQNDPSLGRIRISAIKENASVIASGSASVIASGSASVIAYGSASVTASGSASVIAYGSASVTASGSASVYAYDSASVIASDSASVSAYDSASVSAYGSASVTASGSASVTASGSASVYASGSASVTASGSASVYASGSASVTASDKVSVIRKETSVENTANETTVLSPIVGASDEIKTKESKPRTPIPGWLIKELKKPIKAIQYNIAPTFVEQVMFLSADTSLEELESTFSAYEDGMIEKLQVMRISMNKARGFATALSPKRNGSWFIDRMVQTIKKNVSLEGKDATALYLEECQLRWLSKQERAELRQALLNDGMIPNLETDSAPASKPKEEKSDAAGEYAFNKGFSYGFDAALQAVAKGEIEEKNNIDDALNKVFSEKYEIARKEATAGQTSFDFEDKSPNVSLSDSYALSFNQGTNSWQTVNGDLSGEYPAPKKPLTEAIDALTQRVEQLEKPLKEIENKWKLDWFLNKNTTSFFNDDQTVKTEITISQENEAKKALEKLAKCIPLLEKAVSEKKLAEAMPIIDHINGIGTPKTPELSQFDASRGMIQNPDYMIVKRNATSIKNEVEADTANLAEAEQPETEVKKDQNPWWLLIAALAGAGMANAAKNNAMLETSINTKKEEDV